MTEFRPHPATDLEWPECGGRHGQIELPAGVVDVWQASLDPPAGAIDGLAHLLSTDERNRADRFRFAHLRRRFIVGRGLLRTLLGRYVQRAPEQLVFDYGPRGKPKLIAAAGDSIEFNLAHTDDAAIFAFAWGRRVGIDIERMRQLDDLELLARHNFAPVEVQTWIRLPASQQAAAFFACWTRKEAFIKATGEGLARPLDSFTVTLAPHDPARLVAIDGDADAARRWRLIDLELMPPYWGAVAAEGADWRLRTQPEPG